MHILLSLYSLLKNRSRGTSGRVFTFKCSECLHFQAEDSNVRSLANTVQTHLRRYHGR